MISNKLALTIKRSLMMLLVGMTIIFINPSDASEISQTSVTYYCRVNGKEDIEQPTDWDHVIALDQDSQEKLIQANERTNNFSIIGIVLIGLVILYKSYRRKQSL